MTDKASGLSPVEVGRHIKETRQSLGISLQDFAAQLELSVHAIKKIEDGTSTAQFLKLARIADVLKTTPNQLLGFPVPNRSGRMKPILDSLMAVLQVPDEQARMLIAEIERLLSSSDLDLVGFDQDLVLKVVAQMRFRECCAKVVAD